MIYHIHVWEDEGGESSVHREKEEGGLYLRPRILCGKDMSYNSRIVEFYLDRHNLSIYKWCEDCVNTPEVGLYLLAEMD